MVSQIVLDKTKEFFPDVRLMYKNESTFMKMLGKILFFNSQFMTSFTTTIGSNIYFPNKEFEEFRPISSLVVFLHELIHVYDSKRLFKGLFSFLYLFPITLIPISFLFLLLSWKITLILSILFALPLPAYFRMNFEKRAYLNSLYCMNKLSIKKNIPVNLDNLRNSYLKSFKDSSYYFMWPFSSIDKEMQDGLNKIKLGNRPYEDKVFDIIDKILDVC